MTDQEREDQLFQAEILDRIDTLHAAVVRTRRRRAGYLAGGVVMVALVVGLWNRPSPVDPIPAQGPLVAEAHKMPQGVAVVPEVVRQRQVVEAVSVSKEELPAWADEAPASEVVLQSVEEPMFVAEPETLLAEASLSEPDTSLFDNVPVVAPSTPEALALAMTSSPTAGPTRFPRQYNIRRGSRPRHLLAFSTDPNMDGTSLSVNLM